MKSRLLKARQTGATVMELMISMAMSLIVTSSMIIMMGNSLGNTARIVQMTKLSDDMRVALQMMSRDVRRSSYNANSMFCYANQDCGTDGAITAAADISLVDLDADDSNDCFTFLMDRDHDGDSTEDNAGGFRRVTTGGVGLIEMWTGNAAADCTDDVNAAGWVQITDPEQMDIFDFSIDDDLSYTDEILKNDVTTVSQRVRKVRMNLQGRLVLDNTIQKEMEDIISIRNNLLVLL